MKKIFLISCLVVLVVTSCYSSCFALEYGSISRKELVDIARQFLVENKEYSENRIAKLEGLQFSADDSVNEILSRLVFELRKEGIAVGLYNISSKDVTKVTPPFILCTKEKRLILVSDISRERGYIKYLGDENQICEVSIESFQNLLEDATLILSNFTAGVWLSPVLGNEGNNKSFYIIYSNHDENFEAIRDAMSYVLNIAKQNNQEVIYIDELGLIPLETITYHKNLYKVIEEDAFNKVKNMLSDDLAKLEKGQPIYDSLDTYNNIYSYLATNRIKSLMEDLKYLNWQDIIILDYMGFDKNAFFSFTIGNTALYKATMKDYVYNFWKNNIYLRDNNFSQQVIKLIKDNPGKLIFTIRGIGHYGLAEMLENNGIDTKFFVVGDGMLKENLINQHILFIDYSTGVDVANSVEELILKSLPQEYLRNYFIEIQHKKSREAIIFANRLISKLKNEDIVNLSRNWMKYFNQYKSINKNENSDSRRAILEFVYNWVNDVIRNN